MFLWWGPELIQFYNDAYLPSFGRGKHPAAMGQRGVDCWQEIWPIIHPQIAGVMERGEASWNEDHLVPIYRNDRIEEVYWTYGYSPVYAESGAIGGVLVVCTETTKGVLAIRRLEVVRRLATALNDAQDSADVARITAQSLAEARFDVPYGVVDLEGMPPVLVGLEGTESPALAEPASTTPLAPRKLLRGVACPPWQELVTEAVVHSVDGVPGGTLTFGLSPRLPFDESYRSFLEQIVDQVVSARARLAIEVERRRLLLQAPIAAALLTGPDHVYELANPRYIEMVGREVVGKRYVEAFPEIRGTELPGILDRVYQQGKPFTTHEMLVRLGGAGSDLEDHFFNFSLEPIRDVRGNVYGMMAIALDITPQVVARRSLERSNAERARLLEDAQAAVRAKDEFLAMLGHELRNPLAPIRTAVEVMKVKNVAAVEHEREIIERQAAHLINLVDDLLDVSRVVEGKIELRKARVALGEVVASAIEMASPLFETRRHTLRVEVAPHGLDVDADPTRLAQVIANLLTNAARYTEPGGTVTIRAWPVERELLLRVEDNGIGLAPEQIPRLFERFFQAARATERGNGGLGLGLALVKGLTELHGGSVRAESRGLGQGSAFELRLPLAHGDAEHEALATEDSPTPEASPGERVLLVDDNEDITDLFGTFLELKGFEVRTAHDGPSALRLAAEYEPTVAVLDLGLPVMSGYEIAEMLLQNLGSAAPRLVAMSGYGREVDVARTRQAGFESHLVKPVEMDALLRAIARRA